MRWFGFLLVGMLATATSSGWAQEPSWRGNIVALGEEREVIQETPITERDYRPLHFYGNTIRRRYYRGQVRPSLGDVFEATTALLRRR